MRLQTGPSAERAEAPFERHRGEEGAAVVRPEPRDSGTARWRRNPAPGHPLLQEQRGALIVTANTDCKMPMAPVRHALTRNRTRAMLIVRLDYTNSAKDTVKAQSPAPVPRRPWPAPSRSCLGRDRRQAPGRRDGGDASCLSVCLSVPARRSDNTRAAWSAMSDPEGAAT